jgi:uncharacterized repeat protein (TIGR03803 family)
MYSILKTRFGIIVALLAPIVLLAISQAAQAQVETVLNIFNDGFSTNSGASPTAPLIQASDGNFYGTTSEGGTAGAGTVFKMTPAGVVTVLHSFRDGSVANDGIEPCAGLVQATDGDFYGTTYYGGSSAIGGTGRGTVFRMSPSGTLTILHSFGDGSVANDGSLPYAGLIQASDGNFYGTTFEGGSTAAAGGFDGLGWGTVFRMSESGTVTVIHSFMDGSVVSDGFFPTAGLIQATDGNLYGTTAGGGSEWQGAVFRINFSGSLTILHSFSDGTVSNDGRSPYGGLVQAADGYLYGLTMSGGTAGFGTVFKMTTFGAETILHSFDDGSVLNDGQCPKAGLVQGVDGNLYGTTPWGGSTATPGTLYSGDGTVFSVTTTGAIAILHSFGDGSVPNDGKNPFDGMIRDSAGNFYGTTETGVGLSYLGTVFKLATQSLVVANLNDSGPGSFRDAITCANTAPGSTITFQSGLSGTISLEGGLPDISSAMTIYGPGASVIDVDGGGQCCPLTVSSPGVTISGLTVSGGSPGIDVSGGLTLNYCNVNNNTCQLFVIYGSGGGLANTGSVVMAGCNISGDSIFSGSGGGIDNEGTLTATDCDMVGDSAFEGDGGAIYNDGVATISGCVISGGISTDGVGGGAIFNDGVIDIADSTIAGNRAMGDYFDFCGGAVYSDNKATLSNCTLSGNYAHGDGGAVYSYGETVITGCTLTNNSALGDDSVGYGGGLKNDGKSAVTNCTFESNSATGAGGAISDDTGGVTVLNSVLYSDAEPEIDSEGSTATTATYSDIEGGYSGIGNIAADPRLASLANYGGPTQTMALLPGSPCLGAGTGAGVSADQRGVAIPQNGRYDIGAFESQGFSVSATSGSGQSADFNTVFADPLVATVTANASIEPVAGGLLTFTAPSSGASATVASGPVTIAANGTASTSATANGISGSYSVTASTGAGSTSFGLTNVNPIPPALQSLTVSPSKVVAGATATATITLTEPALAGGFAVAVKSLQPAVATVQTATVTVPAGSTTATFAVSAQLVSSTNKATISATANGVTKTVVLTVAPLAPASLTIVPMSIAGGIPSAGVVQMTGTALVNTTVKLTSNAAAATVPASVVVPAGQSYGSFTIGTSLVSSNTAATISASCGGVTKSAKLTVTAPVLMSLVLLPASVVGGSESVCVLSLTGVVPSAVTFSLSSSSAAAIVPSTVTVPAGQDYAVFVVNTNAVNTTTTATVAASGGGVTKTAKLTIAK